ncbi:O-sialoglycoprotein endopeptidase [Ihubacter massiliensis]|uniref:N(6)-L-threonylcarbamoyladenine synthase n=1 Tax=Hominibacterium faecale TaxID=2839743 RepID=A0A9J6QT63_9FIRM|nr:MULTISPECIES: O-sialoglycoprotein endopeptidase [Eubacteriales Family XIII. Incertae Sedis]MCC2865293.1 O-sialoglycoprotein endopeptidase [Anaerovorax odorimutans]MCI7303871.1 O-sialoglycoprotein endopeptidase [Clostridia bacterium]MDE8732837.1 O-sialoglycoprotein endopeptidase [Eubacteriales bacterium DFI.9.88]MDY3011652.1 O-sialoglycoprotein endopeptidase [Clostridiales Family XIII bacterium]MCO7120983.1 O-sialoglycoprotein endopeptidase [Ihubacter massiliensis]
MLRNRDYVLGIDTSNYKTSAAITDAQGKILCDLRKLLHVKQGERGLRQSDALFQHVENLPKLLEEALADDRARRIAAVACSDRPRPQEGSYMPVFKAGIGFGQAVAAALQVPFFTFSHQEGHIEAIKSSSGLSHQTRFLCYHLSGGTCELLEVNEGNIQIIGGSKDLSFGQVIDRVGVKLGLNFPAGEEMDQLAIGAEKPSAYLKKIPADDLFFNLSGIETQCGRQAELMMQQASTEEEKAELVRELFDKITRILIEITQKASNETSITNIMYTGGVSSSRCISGQLKRHFSNTGISVEFGQQRLSQDNAVGIALLGGKKLWL